MTLTVLAAFTKTTGVPATGLALGEINLYLTAIAKADGAMTVIWDGSQHPTAEVASVGVYMRQYTGEDLSTYDYVAGANYTGATVLDSTWVTATSGGIGQEVWEYYARTLTATAAAVAASVTGSALSITKGATFTATLSGLTIPATWTKVYFTLKRDAGDADSAAIVQIVESNPADAGDGLLYLNGAPAAAAGDGALVVTQAAGTVAITLDDEAAALLTVRGGLLYDMKALSSDGTSTVLTAATAAIAATPTLTV